MAELEQVGKVVETDVLVIGAGVAGLFAGIRARAFVDRVTVVDKGPVGKTSQCYWALGGHHALLPEDNLDDWIQEVVYFHDGLCEQDLVESVYKETFDRIKDFESLGVEFIKEDGHYRRFSTRGLDHVRGLRPHPHGIGGKAEVEVLAEECKRLGVQTISRCFISDLLKSGDAVVGAVGFDGRTGEPYIFKAGAVVVATGQCSFKGHYADQGFLTGDGMAMSFRAGAELKNMEFHTMWMQAADYPWEAIGTALPMGAQFVNAKGEAFLEKYSPRLKSMIDFCFLARAMALEAKKGNGPFYLDHSTVNPKDLAFLKERAGWMELHINKLKEAGVEPFDTRQEWMPVFWTVQGIKTDIDCRSKVPGLFVGGRVRSVDPGITMGSWSIGSATVLGYRAGENAARYAQANRASAIDAGEVRQIKDKIFAPLGEVGLRPESVLLEIQKVVFDVDVLILKEQSSLRAALGQIERIRDEMLPRLRARDVHELVELRQVENMTLIAEVMFRASMMRTESRATHYRVDYPKRDNDNWLQWIVATLEDGSIEFHTVPLPMEKYRFKPTRYYTDNFVIPE